MLIRFLKHSKGSGQAAINYLLGEKDHKGEMRAGVEVMRGDPHLLGALIDSLETVHRYSSGVIAFHPDDKPSDEEVEALLDDFQRAAFPGLEGDQYHFCAVKHIEDDGGLHIHIVVPRIELRSGKALNIAPPGHEFYFSHWRDSWNHLKGWRSPADIENARIFNPEAKSLPDWRVKPPALSKDIEKELSELMSSGAIRDRSQLLDFLSKSGEVTRSGTDYVSFKIEGSKKAVRLKGPFFAEGWVYAPGVEKLQSVTPDLTRATMCAEKFEAQRLKREEYNAKRYSDKKLIIKELDNAESKNINIKSDFKFQEDSKPEHSIEGIIFAEQRITESKSAIAETKRRVNESSKYIGKIDKWLSRIVDFAIIAKTAIKTGVENMFSSKQIDFEHIIRVNEENRRRSEKEEEEIKQKIKDSETILKAIEASKEMQKYDEEEREIVKSVMYIEYMNVAMQFLKFDEDRIKATIAHIESSGDPAQIIKECSKYIDLAYEVKMSEVDEPGDVHEVLKENGRDNSPGLTM